MNAPLSDKFCTRCGARLHRSGVFGEHWRPVIAGLMLLNLALLTVLAWGSWGRGDASQSVAAGQPLQEGRTALGPTGVVDLASMTPEEAALRLFNRVMRAEGSGDTAQARQFAPMAIAAYMRIQVLGADERFHLSLLYVVAGDAAAALDEARMILLDHPSHLLGLVSAAQAAILTGDEDGGAEYYGTFLGSYETEIASGLAEYGQPASGGHLDYLVEQREEARRFLEARREP